MTPDLTPEQRANLLARLCDPFPPNDVMWRVVNMSKNKQRGEVCAYVTKRVYHDRLNALFSTSGWSYAFVTNIISNLTRSKKDQQIATGKVIIVCTLSIEGFGVHSSTGEAWLDDDNASTSAEAQSFKRTSAQFGLGRYIELLNNDKPWVDLDEHRQPKGRPALPDWALPRALRAAARPQPLIAATQGKQLTTGTTTAVHAATQKSALPATAQSSSKPAVLGFGPAKGEDTELSKKFGLLKREVGFELFNDVVRHVSNYFDAGRYIGDRDNRTLECFARAQALLQKLRDLNERVGESRFGLILDEYSVPSLQGFTSIDQLVTVVGAIEKIAA